MSIGNEISSRTISVGEPFVYEDIPWIRFSDTKDLEQINKAVYSPEVSLQRLVYKNPLLTEEQFRHLVKQKFSYIDRAFMIENPSFPTKLLFELANTEENSFVRGFIFLHPNIDEATRVCLILRGYDDVSSWK